uniref:Uncharacterized protein n=1 Tax=Neobodo designis TaxID=312471 RepID=A0A7S1KZQ3_NEODS|eukprot:CAMPEP_0174856056 /NCGR_PEP_ID=MMETSP1114-20130205/34966_1 /TAXON_ID=312471 /ORGANISM="Neobodo designis, Strain CCAP 1951/1" /LENGTH=419 /DNA_ID=CAMNT_0016090831 /DNA_START=64 /DNA_END=1323 /DNA_ORIENTATION=+
MSGRSPLLSKSTSSDPDELTAADFKALEHYKYSGTDFSLCSKYFMQRYWTAVSECVPKTIAPNALTLTGFIVSTSTSVILAYFALAGLPFPNWVWAYAAVSLFTYQTLDAIDGKQARRTGCGSPLGELFDHGCDALFTPLINLTSCIALGFTATETFFYCMAVNSALFFSLFEQFSTGTLDLGYLNAPVDGILLSCGVLFWTAFAGPQWWATPFAAGPLVNLGAITIPVIGTTVNVSFFTKANELLFAVGILGSFFTSLGNVAHAWTMPLAHARVNRVATLLPQTILGASIIALGWYAPALATGPYAFAVELAYGWLVSFTVTRMTVARLCRRPYDPLTIPFRATLFATLLTGMYAVAARVTGGEPNAALLGAPFALCVFVTLLCYARMAWKVFRRLARHLGINILTMTEAQLARNRAK